MDGFLEQLKELAASNDDTISSHCKRVALRLLRRLKPEGAAGIRGQLELRYLLQDLLDSLPHISSIASSDRYEHLRAFAKLFTTPGQDIPLKKTSNKLKRPAISNEGDENDISPTGGTALKRSRTLDSKEDAYKALQDLQAVYSWLAKSKESTLTTSKPSLQSILQDRLESSSSALYENEMVSSDTESRNLPFQTFAEFKTALEEILPVHDKAAHFRISALSLAAKLYEEQPSNDAHVAESLLDILAKLCAPVRDSQVREIRDALSSHREYSATPSKVDKSTNTLLQAKQGLFKLVENMQLDLKLFKIGLSVKTQNEDELRKALITELSERERKIVKQLHEDPIADTRRWIQSSAQISQSVGEESTFTVQNLGVALVTAIFENQAVSVAVVGASGHRTNGPHSERRNDLPPVLYVAAGPLPELQNRIQACVILAALSVLVKPFLQSSSLQAQAGMSWSQRIWTLLVSASSSDNPTDSNAADNGGFKLANLADEVVSFTRRSEEGNLQSREKEQEVRNSVNRIIRFEDSVFKLLHSRLKAYIAAKISSGTPASSQDLQSTLKGFDMDPLPAEIKAISETIEDVLNWARETWSIAQV